MTHHPPLTRRELIAGALGSAALAAPQPTGAREPDHTPLAKHVIFLYMSGAYSHVDTFDPKPRLTKDHDVSIGNGPGEIRFRTFSESPSLGVSSRIRAAAQKSATFFRTFAASWIRRP